MFPEVTLRNFVYAAVAMCAIHFVITDKEWKIYSNMLTYLRDLLYPAVLDPMRDIFPFVFTSTYVDLMMRVIAPRLATDTSSPNNNLYTKSELAACDGDAGKELYISLLGNVLDVQAGANHYGPGQDYHGFAGRDATKAFITGDFSEKGLIDDVSDLAEEDFVALDGWLTMLKDKYKYKGKLVGRFFDENGNPTEYGKQIADRTAKAKEKAKANQAIKEEYPGCNSEWNSDGDNNAKVWCSRKSGGIKRTWKGVPRKLYLPGSATYQCACIKDAANFPSDNGFLKEFEGCPSDSHICFINTA